MTPLKRIRQNRLLRKWHRRAGLVSAIFMLWMATTGAILNHSDDIGLSKIPLSFSWLRELYKMPEPVLHSFRINSHWLTQADDRQLFFDSTSIGECKGELVGAEAQTDFLIGICAEELLLLDRNGKVLDRINKTHGLPTPLTAAIVDAGNLFLSSAGETLQADLDQLQFKPVSTNIQWHAAETASASVRNGIVTAISGRDLNAERVLLDLHSGRLLGLTSKWLLDITALMIIVLTVTGCWLWWRHVRHPHH